MEFLINTCLETTSEFRQLALYSHLLPTLVIALLTIFVYRNTNRANPSTITFLIFTSLLGLWLICDLIVWHSDNYYFVAAFWSGLDYINILFYLVLVCFFIVQTLKLQKVPVFAIIGLMVVSILPLIITVAGTAVGEFDETNCEMAGNDALAIYKLGVEWMSIISIIGIGFYASYQHWVNKKHRNQVIVLTISSVIFLAIFSSSEYIATLTDIYEISLYALFTLPIFLVILTYNIVEQGTLSSRGSGLVTARLLFLMFIVVALFNLVLADDTAELAITGASTVVTMGFGVLLLRSAQREVGQRKEIEKLAHDLETANVRLKELDKQKSEFVSIASHQLRSPLTAIRGYAAMMSEGSFGALNAKMVEPITRIQDSARLMAVSIEDFLNVSRIEGGNMKYELSDFNLRDRAERIVDDLRPEGFKKGLLLLFKQQMDGKGIVHADIGKTEQIIHNLINNALKYTPKGTITVYVHDDKKKKQLYLEIIDTGIGMSNETILSLFEKFTRAKNANSVNIKGTGLGLYVAREMARAMGGDITAHSEGEGKGSRFVFTMPLVM